ncbi:MAG TPA: FGGY-family carbohydrate kinase [Geminicoccus sp.]|jgi:L-xylulokinase|uniref:FGGY-family carbohydrate kinase n=1 Tax=Geminicoccus sp. TaxID=2024832 RepID=UPI002E3274DB|nr:FGGY-family carbohydrate kinase [Geminicoccus sp.]HEX2529013.1 FGGY-family carbohydrate kinase [Geminicoccus sp.]
MTKYVLGIDSGLTITKAALFDEQGRLAGVGRADVTRHEPLPRHVERDMEEHWLATCKAIADALQAAGATGDDVAAIGMSGHGDGLYPLDRDSRPLGRAILSLDGRAHEVVERWQAEGRFPTMLAAMGQEVAPSSPTAVLSWIKQHEPERYARFGHLLYCKDWLRFRLTGSIATDRTEASTAFTNVQTQLYDPDVAALFDLPEVMERLPPALEPTSIAGYVTEDAAQATGLRVGTPVAAGLHDVTATAVGIGVVEAGQLALVAGTYCINEVISSLPVIDRAWFCRNGFAPGTWMNMSISPASSANIDWFVGQFCRDAAQTAKAQGVSVFQVLEPELAAAFAREGGIVYHPFLYGSPHAAVSSAAFMGVLGRHERGDLMRALIEGVVFNHRTHVDALRRGFPLDRAALAGGGARSPRIAQLFADALNLPVVVPDAEEVGALGAAMCAGVAAGWFDHLSDAAAVCCRASSTYQPEPAAAARLDLAYRRYIRSVGTVQGLWPSLNGSDAA